MIFGTVLEMGGGAYEWKLRGGTIIKNRKGSGKNEQNLLARTITITAHCFFSIALEKVGMNNCGIS